MTTCNGPEEQRGSARTMACRAMLDLVRAAGTRTITYRGSHATVPDVDPLDGLTVAPGGSNSPPEAAFLARFGRALAGSLLTDSPSGRSNVLSGRGIPAWRGGLRIERMMSHRLCITSGEFGPVAELAHMEG
jgi:hypothetical protein